MGITVILIFSNKLFLINLRLVSEPIIINKPIKKIKILCLLKLILSFEYIIINNAERTSEGM